MKVNVTQPIMTLAGQPFVNKDESGQTSPILLRTLCIGALIDQELHRKTKAEDKVRNAILAQRIYQEDAPELKAEEVAELKRLIGEMYPPLIVMRAWELLDPQ